MQHDEGAADAKLTEINRAASSARSALPEEAIDAAIKAFSQVTPPEEPEAILELITISSMYSTPKARSRKPGNVLLNWRRLMAIVPDVSLAGLGATSIPVATGWAVVLAGLYIWNKILRGSTEEFSDVEAVVVLAMWKNRDAHNKIPEVDGFARTNELRASYSLPPLTQAQFSAAVDRLVGIRCLELEGGIIWLCEWVRVKYQ